jgi:imidazolonepropionase-like amidohydrolase
VVVPGEARVRELALEVADGRIVRIAAAPGGASSEVVDYAGAYVLPGLVDLHTHLPPDTALDLTPYACLLYLRFGVTSVRDAGDVDGTAVPAARTGIREGRFPGPRVFACGPFIGGEPARWANTVVLGGPEDAETAVERVKAAGFDCVKSYDELELAEIRAVQAAADRHGLAMIGHVPAALAYEEALVPDVQHFFGVPEPRSLAGNDVRSRVAGWQDVDDARLERIVAATLAHGIVNTPTLVSSQRLLLYSDREAAVADPLVRLLPRLYRDVVWHPTEGLPFYRDLPPEFFAQLRDSLAKKKELVRRLHAAGAELRIGTDVQQPFVVPGASVHEEMRLFAEAGVPLDEVWAIATRQAGEALRVPGLGTIAEGAPADLVLFREDPTRDLAALDTIEAVVAQGRLYRREDLDAAVAAHQARFEGFVFDRLSVAAARRILRASVKRES